MAEIVLTASDSTMMVTETVTFVSAPLAIDADPLTQALVRSESAVRANEELLPAVSTLTILHSNNTLGDLRTERDGGESFHCGRRWRNQHRRDRFDSRASTLLLWNLSPPMA